MKAVFRNFITTLHRFRLATSLNIVGLSVSFAAFIIIVIQVDYEYTFDTSYKKSGCIYRVESTMVPAESTLASKETYTAFFARPLIEMLLTTIPQIESYTILYGSSSEMYVTYETEEGEKRGMMIPFYKVSDRFPEVFDMEMIEGNAFSLSDPEKVLLPESLARKLFGNKPAVGRPIYSQAGNRFFTIGGVYRDFPENTSMINDIKIGLGNENKDNWMDWTHLLFVTLPPEVSSEEVAILLQNFFNETGIGKQMGFQDDTFFRLKPIEDIYYSQDTSIDVAPKGNRTMTNILLSIALLVIVVAVINFLNFSTALTPIRIKNIHIRKILGSSTIRLRVMLLIETLGICMISFILSVVWIWLLDMAGISSALLSSIHPVQHTRILFFTFLLLLTVGIIAGMYPAVYMTSFQPALVLKGAFGMSSTGRKLRLLLTGFQFVVSIGLIIAALFVWLQNRYVYHMEGILNNDRIVTVCISKDMMGKNSEVLTHKLKSSPDVVGVAFSEWPIGFLDYYLYTYAKTPENEDIRYYYLPVSYNFTDVIHLGIIEGRGFRQDDTVAPEERLIFNKLAAKQFNIQPGDKLSNGSLVVGIVDDFHFMNLRKPIEPMAFSSKYSHNPIWMPTVYIRTAGNACQTVEHIQASIAEIDPLYPVEITFYDRQIEETYRKERNTSFQITMFSFLAIIISLIGVFGLITFETQYRRKEIAIRKAMGSTVFEILMMLNKRFVAMVVVCFFIAAPIAWYGISEWLKSFAYRTPLHGWIFAYSTTNYSSNCYLTKLAGSKY